MRAKHAVEGGVSGEEKEIDQHDINRKSAGAAMRYAGTKRSLTLRYALCTVAKLPRPISAPTW